MSKQITLTGLFLVVYIGISLLLFFVPSTTATAVSNFDVVVTGQPNQPIHAGQQLDVFVTVAHNSKKTIEGKVAVSISGDYYYQQQKKTFVMKHHDTVISDESKHILFDTSTWEAGKDYHIVISFPVQRGEINSINNIYEYDVRVIGSNNIITADLSLDTFIVAPDYWCLGLNCEQKIKRLDRFLVYYTISNKGTLDTSGILNILSEGATLHSMSFKRLAGETRNGVLYIDTGKLPFHPTGWNYLIVGRVDSTADTNIKNNIQNMFYYFGANRI